MALLFACSYFPFYVEHPRQPILLTLPEEIQTRPEIVESWATVLKQSLKMTKESWEKMPQSLTLVIGTARKTFPKLLEIIWWN